VLSELPRYLVGLRDHFLPRSHVLEAFVEWRECAGGVVFVSGLQMRALVLEALSQDGEGSRLMLVCRQQCGQRGCGCGREGGGGGGGCSVCARCGEKVLTSTSNVMVSNLFESE
jgi:hypothetical protein